MRITLWPTPRMHQIIYGSLLPLFLMMADWVIEPQLHVYWLLLIFSLDIDIQLEEWAGFFNQPRSWPAFPETGVDSALLKLRLQQCWQSCCCIRHFLVSDLLCSAARWNEKHLVDSHTLFRLVTQMHDIMQPRPVILFLLLLKHFIFCF